MAFQFAWIELLGYFLSLGPSLRLDEKVQPGDDEAVARPAVGAAHGFGQSHVLPVLRPGDDVINEMPVSRARMHP